MPKTRQNPGYGVVGPKDDSLEEHTRFATEYVSALKKEFGTTELALMAYNWGPGNVQKWIKEGSKREDIPEETKNYVNKILG